MLNRLAPTTLAFALTALCNCASAATGAPGKLHVASPDWRDQIVYFVVTDRFDDADPRNNDQGAGEFDPRDNAKYNGGDLRGLQRRLDYISGLGATAVWITPPVANQWWDPKLKFSGYHGYWARNFMQVDRHLGTLADYRQLSRSLHGKGMYLVQDIVVNHTGNYIGEPGAARPSAAPTQPPFHLNDPANPAHRRAAIYHWTPNVSDFSDANQMLNYQMSQLDDLNTENPRVRDALRRSYGHWIRQAGVDAFRVDTAFYVPSDYFADFMHSRDARRPGIARVARQTGRKDFLVFGEGFAIDRPYDDTHSRKIESYMNSPDGSPLLPGMLNFPLYGAIGDVFARGRPTAELAHRIRSMMTLHRRPHLMPSFVDNHDVDRFLAAGTEAGLKQSLLLMMTLPGIPTLYYGTEQGYTEQRGAMFAAGFASGGRDRFDSAAPLYRYIQRVSALRRGERLFSRGVPTVLKDNAAAAGVFAYRMAHGDRSAIVVLNSSDQETLLDNLETGLPAGTRLAGVFAIDGAPTDIQTRADGSVTLKLPPRSGFVWKPKQARPLANLVGAISLDPLASAPVTEDFAVSGTAHGVASFKLVVDGDLAGSRSVTPAADGRWSATLDTSRMVDPAIRHNVVAWSEQTGAVSASRSFRVQRDWKLLADVADPAGDDHGANGRYSYPDDAGWRSPRQMDIRGIKVSGAGGALKIDLAMNRITHTWNPPNGFDHVAFTLFIELPGAPGGTSVMPLQNATLPAGMRWHYRLRAHGWTNALFGADGASATREGTPATPAADIRVDAATHTASFVLPAASLGNPRSLSGAKIYVTTWDYDGGYRPLTPQAGAHSLGGGDAAVDPLVMDDSGVITLP